MVEAAIGEARSQLDELTVQLERGPGAREAALAATKLEEAELWLLRSREQFEAAEAEARRDALAHDPERLAAIAACPTPAFHETHRYCPSCPWTLLEPR